VLKDISHLLKGKKHLLKDISHLLKGKKHLLKGISGSSLSRAGGLFNNLCQRHVPPAFQIQT